jgi:malate dehydrogenase (oxaloacetate-decarboxylating)
MMTQLEKRSSAAVSLREKGYQIINDPLLNKGMAFTREERIHYHLLGLIPPDEESIVEQAQRAYEDFSIKSSNIEKYLFLRALQDTNETLFYNLISKHITEMLPVVYTPTVGDGCQQFSHHYRHPRGIFLSYCYKDYLDDILANPHFDKVEAIVVSDGERILGLGDQGAGGMGIPIGKLSLYTACAGVNPEACLPIILDTGTNNMERIGDPLYVGWKHERIRGEEYNQFIDAFVKAIKKRFPHVLLQWEDFAQQNANPILAKYREKLCTFNDDIQGTAAVATGTLLAAVNVTGIPLKDQKIVVVGGGSAGCGISKLIMQTMIREGVTEEEAASKFFVVDRYGLLVDDMSDLLPFQKPFAKKRHLLKDWKVSSTKDISLYDVIRNVKPTLLLGVSGQPGIFTEEIVKEMASHVDLPIIFPLSNPTNRCEATPQDLMRWTDGHVVMGTGSPFPDIQRDGHPFRVDQVNNSYIFPGMALGIVAVKPKIVTDEMFMIAAKELARNSPSRGNPDANLLPSLEDIRQISFNIAKVVAQEALDSGLATVLPENGDLDSFIRSKVWEPIYKPFI